MCVMCHVGVDTCAVHACGRQRTDLWGQFCPSIFMRVLGTDLGLQA